MKLIRVKGNYNGITLESGKELFKNISNAILDGEKVTLDFVNQEYLTAVFLNASIGYLFAYFKADIIDERLSVLIPPSEKDETSHLDKSIMITKTIKNGRKYWNDKEFKDAVDVTIAKMSEEMDR